MVTEYIPRTWAGQLPKSEGGKTQKRRKSVHFISVDFEIGYPNVKHTVSDLRANYRIS